MCTQLGEYLPIIVQLPEIVIGNPPVEMSKEVLPHFIIRRVDVSRKIQVVVIGINFGQGNHAGVPRYLLTFMEDIHGLLDILLAQTVLRAVLDEAFAGVDHENTIPGGGVFLVQNNDAGGNTRPIKQIRRQADDSLDDASLDQVPADIRLCVAPEQNAVGKNARALARLGLHGLDDMKQEGIVSVLFRGNAVLETVIKIGSRLEPRHPVLLRKRRIGDHVVECPQDVSVLEARIGQRVAIVNDGGILPVQHHVHPGKAGCGTVLFLPVDGYLDRGSLCRPQQERAGAACRVIESHQAFAVRRAVTHADDGCNQARNFGRGIKLAFRFP